MRKKRNIQIKHENGKFPKIYESEGGAGGSGKSAEKQKNRSVKKAAAVRMLCGVWEESGTDVARGAARVMFGEVFGARGGNVFLGGGGISGRAVPSDLAKAETGVVRQQLRCAHQPRDFAFFERSAAAGKAKLGGKSAPSFVGTGENIAYQRVFFVLGNN